MQNIILAVVGVVLTILAGLAIAPSISNTQEKVKASKVVEEVTAVRNASLLWLVNDSVNGLFTGINAESTSGLVPDLTLSGTGATSTLGSRIFPGDVTYALAVDGTNADQVQVTITLSGTANTDEVKASIENRIQNLPYTNATAPTFGAGDSITINFRG
ncbi:MAG: hypothetical protein WCS28_11280 [Thiomicrospira sp.]